jgi:prepilin-type N-terminal cleavage/methylation domain-containing protein
MLRQRGVSLLELLLVLCVAAVLMVAALSRYQRYRFSMDAEQVHKSVTLLQQGLTDYFFENCKGNHPELAKLSAQDFLKNQLGWSDSQIAGIAQPFGTDYQVEILGPKDSTQQTKVKYWLRVYAKLDKVETSAIPTYLKLLNASGCIDASGNDEPSCTSKILVWQRLPWYSIPGVSSDLWILAGSLQRFDKGPHNACSGDT